MGWVVAALMILGILTLVGLVATKRREPERAEDRDILYSVGIVLAGTGAALIATLGYSALGITGLGVVLIILGARRTNRSPR